MLWQLVMVLVSVITVLYGFRIIIYGFYTRMRTLIQDYKKANSPVSVIIPVRNEIDHLPSLLNDLQNQDYPENEFDLIFVDDGSADGSADLLKTFVSQNNSASYFTLPEDKQGKKAALQLGAQKARYAWIIQVDADCRLPSAFLSAHMKNIDDRIVLQAGPVRYAERSGFFHNLEALEFYSLAGITSGSFLSGKPLLCNGAHMGYSKDFFMEAKDHLNAADHPSGDDIFLLEYALLKEYPVSYLDDASAIVTTEGAGSPGAFLQQRLRWGSKARYYKYRGLKTLGLIIGLMNLTIVMLAFLSVFDHLFFRLFLAVFITKVLADGYYLYRVTRALKHLSILKYYIPGAIIYPLYFILTGIFSIFTGFNWKNRKY